MNWLDTGDVTTTVDPVGFKPWIGDSHDKFKQSAQRDGAQDTAQVRALLGWHTSSAKPFRDDAPSDSEVERLDKFPLPRQEGDHEHWWRGAKRDPARHGKLPAVEALKRMGLPNASRGEIEAQIRDHERRVGGRLFARDSLNDQQI